MDLLFLGSSTAEDAWAAFASLGGVLSQRHEASELGKVPLLEQIEYPGHSQPEDPHFRAPGLKRPQITRFWNPKASSWRWYLDVEGMIFGRTLCIPYILDTKTIFYLLQDGSSLSGPKPW